MEFSYRKKKKSRKKQTHFYNLTGTKDGGTLSNEVKPSITSGLSCQPHHMCCQSERNMGQQVVYLRGIECLMTGILTDLSLYLLSLRALQASRDV